MVEQPLILALANPVPEIMPEEARKVRPKAIIATGRSDYPNQVNNVLCFPFLFRGALDVGATQINAEMRLACVRAIADLVQTSKSNLNTADASEVLDQAYKGESFHFGPEYIIPKPFDPRLISEIPPAIAKAAMDSGVARMPIKDWDAYKEALEDRLGSGSKLMRIITNRAKSNPKKVVFAEADHLSVLKAAQIAYDEGIAIPILLGNKVQIKRLMKEIQFDAKIQIIDPKAASEENRRNKFAEVYWDKKQRAGITLLEAQKWMRERNYFAAMMVNENYADALVTGYTRNYPVVAKPIIDLIGKIKGIEKIAATNLMLTKRGPLFLSDTAMNIDPNAKELTEIVRMTNKTMKMFGLTPNLAMVSFSNFGSSKSKTSKKIGEVIDYLHTYFSEINIDGELQIDFALNTKMRMDKFPFSTLKDKKVNGLIYPNLESANISYKLLKELNGTESIGPIIMGLNKPVHLLQLGASVDEMVNMVCIAVVDAQERGKIRKH
jgi:malate dehydrogenase (oxaloacetate-decarboxylating)(NADP+)